MHASLHITSRFRDSKLGSFPYFFLYFNPLKITGFENTFAILRQTYVPDLSDDMI